MSADATNTHYGVSLMDPSLIREVGTQEEARMLQSSWHNILQEMQSKKRIVQRGRKPHKRLQFLKRELQLLCVIGRAR